MSFPRPDVYWGVAPYFFVFSCIFSVRLFGWQTLKPIAFTPEKLQSASMRALVLLTCLFLFCFQAPAYGSSKADRKATTEKILSHEMGGIVFYQKQKKCVFSFKNVATGEVVKKSAKKRFNIVAVPEGTYAVNEVNCAIELRHVKNTTVDITRLQYGSSDLDPWYKTFEVKAGEVRYPGTLNAWPVYNAFTVYHVFNNDKLYDGDDVKKQTKKKFPDLAGKLRLEPLEARIDARRLSDKLKEFYEIAPGEEEVDFAAADRNARPIYQQALETGLILE